MNTSDRTTLAAEKAGTACVLTALMLAWFLALDMAGVDLGVSLLVWAGLAPFLLYPLLGCLVRKSARLAEARADAAVRREKAAEMHDLCLRTETQIQTIADCCDRLLARSRAQDLDFGRANQEATAIGRELVRLQEELSRAAAAARAKPRRASRGGGAGWLAPVRPDRAMALARVRGGGLANSGADI